MANPLPESSCVARQFYASGGSDIVATKFHLCGCPAPRVLAEGDKCMVCGKKTREHPNVSRVFQYARNHAHIITPTYQGEMVELGRHLAHIATGLSVPSELHPAKPGTKELHDFASNLNCIYCGEKSLLPMSAEFLEQDDGITRLNVRVGCNHCARYFHVFTYDMSASVIHHINTDDGDTIHS